MIPVGSLVPCASCGVSRSRAETAPSVLCSQHCCPWTRGTTANHQRSLQTRPPARPTMWQVQEERISPKTELRASQGQQLCPQTTQEGSPGPAWAGTLLPIPTSPIMSSPGQGDVRAGPSSSPCPPLCDILVSIPFRWGSLRGGHSQGAACV